MSDPSPQREPRLDLSQLAVERKRPEAPSVGPRRRWVTRYVAPALVLMAFCGLFAWAARDSFLPATTVTVTPVVVSRAEVTREGEALFQAAGWVEPRPTPVVASALTPGVISELLVIEGQAVERGEPVARLIDVDARLALEEAEARHALEQADVERATAALTAAETDLANPVALRAALAEAHSRLAAAQRELANLPYQIKTARSNLELAEENVRRKEQAGDAVSGRALRAARGALAVAANRVDQLVASESALRDQIASLKDKRAALAEQLELLTDERRAVAVARADLAAAQARAERARLAVETAKLALERTVVRAPISGRVLSLEASPGQRLGDAAGTHSQGSGAVVSLYDPESLQVRVDVRLEDVPQVAIGQPATIETAALPGPIAGHVISITTRADIQKNTLQVKVGIDQPPAVVKPEMLAKVTLLAPPSPTPEGEDGESPLRLFVPQSLVVENEQGASVWVADLTQRIAVRKPVSLGRTAAAGGLVEVVRGLTPTDKLVVGGREQLAEGARVRVAGEHSEPALSGGASLGRAARVTAAATPAAEQTK